MKQTRTLSWYGEERKRQCEAEQLSELNSCLEIVPVTGDNPIIEEVFSSQEFIQVTENRRGDKLTTENRKFVKK